MKRNILDWTFREAIELCKHAPDCKACVAYREDYEKIGWESCVFAYLTGSVPGVWIAGENIRLYTSKEIEDAKSLKMIYPDATTIIKKEWGIELRAGDDAIKRGIDIRNKDLFPTLEVGECLEIEDVLGEE